MVQICDLEKFGQFGERIPLAFSKKTYYILLATPRAIWPLAAGLRNALKADQGGSVFFSIKFWGGE